MTFSQKILLESRRQEVLGPNDVVITNNGGNKPTAGRNRAKKTYSIPCGKG